MVNTSIIQLLCSNDWKEYLSSLSKTINFELSIYSEDGTQHFITEENTFCSLIKKIPSNGLDCPASCNKTMFEALEMNKTVTNKCAARIINYSVPLKRNGEKALLIGRGGFISYEDFLEFLKKCRNHNVFQIPVTTPISFVKEDYVKIVSQYSHKTISCLLSSLDEKSKLEEKMKRLTALLNSSTFEVLSKNRDYMYTYIIDTIEFIFGNTSCAMMVMDEGLSSYKTVYCSGKDKNILKEIQIDADNDVIREMLSTRETVFSVDSKRLEISDVLGEMEPVHLLPIFISDHIDGLIGIFKRGLIPEEISMINSFRDYIQVTLENQSLRTMMDKKTDEILAFMLNMSISIANVLDTKHLFRTILEKAVQLLKAEQGSLMLLNYDKSELLVEAKKNIDNFVKEDMKFRSEEGIAGQVLKSGVPLLVEDIERDPRVKQKNRDRYKTKSFVSVPIRIEDRVSGVLNVSDKVDGDSFGINDLRLLQSFTANASIAIERSFFFKQAEELKKLSVTDPLTGLYNRRYINHRIKEEITRYRRYSYPFSFLMLDLDGFKKYNDTYGHLQGDNLLKVLAKTIEHSLRSLDIAGRFGGDEFVVILSQTPKAEAIMIANRLREKLSNTFSSDQMEVPSEDLTTSFGLTTFPDDVSSIKEVLEKTDQMLYDAKKEGGNRVVHLLES